MQGWWIVLLFALIGSCLFVCLGYRRQITGTMQMLLERLDRAIGGELQEVSYEETMDSAIIERLNRILQIAGMNQERAEQERDAVKMLVSDISHQVRTPLTNMMLYTGLLREAVKETEISKETLRLAEKLEQQAERLDFFMKELMKSAYVEQEMIALHPEMVSVGELMRTACQTMEMAAMRKGIAFYMEAEGVDTLCFADRKWTIEAIENVLENAVKYSPEHSPVRLRVIPYESFVCIEVSDQGIGIREEEQGLVFGRFYRSNEVKGEPGFGIGLYLVREVLSRQGGYAKVISKPGKGTKLQMFLSKRGQKE
ncbi:MAG: HAMP domain-containing histidine kinase [Lachnospiraceae bacterium]|jgi:signal transduction histidine kinase|nr:HAMP domain-containing histidine kinase [Lachnospiraceae bacterium]